jgi:hypothetical protein
VIDEEVERLRPDDITGHRYDLAGTLRLTLDGVISRPDTLRRRETCMRCARRRRVELTETGVYLTELGTIFRILGDTHRDLRGFGAFLRADRLAPLVGGTLIQFP